MRWVHFRTLLRLAMHALTAAPAPPGALPAITVDPNAPWAYSVDGLEVHGWRTFDWSALVPAHSPQPPEVS